MSRETSLGLEGLAAEEIVEEIQMLGFIKPTDWMNVMIHFCFDRYKKEKINLSEVSKAM